MEWLKTLDRLAEFVDKLRSNESLKQQIEILNCLIKSLREQLNALQGRMDELETQVGVLKKEVDQLREQLAFHELTEDYVRRGPFLFKKDSHGGFSDGPRCPDCRVLMSQSYKLTKYQRCGYYYENNTNLGMACIKF